MNNSKILLGILCAIGAMILVSSHGSRVRAQALGNQQQVLDMQKKFQELTVAGDGDGVAALMSDDAIFIHGNGAAQSKAEFVAAIKAGQMAFSMYDLREPKVLTFDGGAIVSGLVDLAFKAPAGATAPPRVIHMRGSSVWVKAGSGWKLILDQDTSISAPPAAQPAASR